MSSQAPFVGQNLRRFRAERQLSLAAVADQASISVATLSRIETGRQTVGVDLLLTLARILEVDSAALLGGAAKPDDPKALSRALAKLRPAERARVIVDSARHPPRHAAAAVLNDLLLTLDVLREELLEVQQGVKRRRKR